MEEIYFWIYNSNYYSIYKVNKNAIKLYKNITDKEKKITIGMNSLIFCFLVINIFLLDWL